VGGWRLDHAQKMPEAFFVLEFGAFLCQQRRIFGTLGLCYYKAGGKVKPKKMKIGVKKWLQKSNP
jgi:hypothetical protein